MLNDTYAISYSPSEHIAVDSHCAVQRESYFLAVICEKHKYFDVKISKVCEVTGSTYSTGEQLGKDSKIQHKL